ncbi:MAG: hypothetical protein ACR2PY_06960 [Salinispira sp.]
MTTPTTSGTPDSCAMCSDTQHILVLQQVIGKQTHTVYLCKQCAELMGIERNSDHTPLRIGDLFAAVLDPTGADAKDGKFCGHCGCTYLDLRHSGMVGCSNCYEVFKDEITFHLRRINIRKKHRGKLPRSLHIVSNLLIKKPALNYRLEQALQREDYEDAVRIQAQIKHMEDES